MVHALREARRVLRPGGILVDLRPAAEHRRVGLGEGPRWRLVGVMRETFGEDRAADRAVARVIRDGLFRLEARVELPLERWMDSMDDFRTWVAEFGQRRALASHEFLFRRLRSRLERGAKTIVARGPIVLRLLRKTGRPSAAGSARGMAGK